jgi:hypothetical protein
MDDRAEERIDGPWPVLELRRYTLHPGRRDELAALFEAEFIESQERLRMRVLGHFADRDRPDQFVWLRGFRDMEQRRRGLEAFYGGPVWAGHGAAANATMIDSDDVLLLRPVSADTALRPRPPGERDAVMPVGFVLAATIHVEPRSAPGPAHRVAEGLLAVLERQKAGILGRYQTEPAANTFPRLPVRADRVVVVFAATLTAAEQDAAVDAVRCWSASGPAAGDARVDLARLVPLRRSTLDGTAGRRSPTPQLAGQDETDQG